MFHLGLKVLVLLLPSALLAQEICDKWQVKINATGANLNRNGGLDVDNGLNFPNGTFWKKGDNYVGCPCKVKTCLPHCTS